MAFCATQEEIEKYGLIPLNGPFNSQDLCSVYCSNPNNIYFQITDRKNSCNKKCINSDMFDKQQFFKTNEYFDSQESCEQSIDERGACFTNDMNNPCFMSLKCECPGAWDSKVKCHHEQAYFAIFNNGCYSCVAKQDLQSDMSIFDAYANLSQCLQSAHDLSPKGACCIDNMCQNSTLCECQELNGIFFEDNSNDPCKNNYCKPKTNYGYSCIQSGGVFCRDCIEVPYGIHQFSNLEDCIDNCTNQCWIENCCAICPPVRPPKHSVTETTKYNKPYISDIKIYGMSAEQCRWSVMNLHIKDFKKNSCKISTNNLPDVELPTGSNSEYIHTNKTINNNTYVLPKQIIYKDKILVFNYSDTIKEYENLPAITQINLWFWENGKWLQDTIYTNKS